MHPHYQPVSASFDPNDEEQMKAMQTFMDAMADSYERDCLSVAQELHLSEQCACDVVYLRGRSRWTEELEAELIRLHRAGTPPNIFEFGN